MKTFFLILSLFLFAGLLPEASAQTGRPNPEKIWKDLSRLPQNLRDDLKKTDWWKNADAEKSAAVRLDSTVKYSSFSAGKPYPLNKSTFEHPSAGKTIQSDFVNYGEWVPQKRTTISRDAQSRVVEVLEEEPDASGAFQPAAKLNFYWHGSSDRQCDSIFSSRWDDQWQQWLPEYRLLSVFDAQGRETATETYRFVEGMQFVGLREEFQLDAAGDATRTQQFLAKEGKWISLGNVESTFDPQHRELTRLESIALGAGKSAPVRKLRRTYNSAGQLTLEERAKWNEADQQWAPLKSISAGTDVKKRMDWSITDSHKPNATFQSKVETFRRNNSNSPDHELHSSYMPKTKSWQVVADIRYYYAK
ncbi:MAG: hypothetical protein IT260_21250 [Saprospiraceae bacterium]|nr:hypothetical protein [Saprospiraceae bacterium]